jgi:hypothetical protein
MLSAKVGSSAKLATVLERILPLMKSVMIRVNKS